MGYTTYFEGEINIEPPLNYAEMGFLRKLADSRRMDRVRGPLYVGGGQSSSDPDIINHNRPHPDQPGLNLQWEVSSDGTAIYWNGAEKFYSSAEWLKYLIENLFTESGRDYVEQWKATSGAEEELNNFTFNHVFNGTIDAQGEDASDLWRILVEDSVVKVAEAQVTYGEAKEI